MNPKLVVAPAAVLLIIGLLIAFKDGDRTPVATGTIELDDVQIASRAGGRVVELMAAEGDALTNGQVVVRLEAPDLEARRRALAARLAELEKGPREEDIAAAKARLAALEASHAFAAEEAARRERLHADKTIATSDRDEAVSRANELAENKASAKANLDLLLAGTRSEVVDHARAELEAVDAMIAELVVRAPAATVLENLHVKVGDVPPANAPLATLVFLQDPWARVYVPEPWLARIAVGDKLPVRIDGFEGRTFDGRIEQIHRLAEFTPRNVQTAEERVKQVFGVKLRFDGQSATLRPGLGVEVTFPDKP